jgi:hypothetical protein
MVAAFTSKSLAGWPSFDPDSASPWRRRTVPPLPQQHKAQTSSALAGAATGVWSVGWWRVREARLEATLSSATRLWRWASQEDVNKPVFHCSLSAAPEDKISAERWLDIAADFVKRMGYENSPWVAIRHHDTAIDHVHIVASRIDNDGSYVPNQEKKRSQTVCRELEKEYDLRQLYAPSRRATPTRDHLAVFERTGSVTVKACLQEHIDLAARDRPTMTVFVERLETHGIEVRANIAATGHVSGISFAKDGVACKGSDLGRGYSWRQLQERAGISYEPARDLASLRAAAARATTFIAEKKSPLVRDPAALPVPPLARPAEAFGQAAVVESRAELAQRHEQLTHQLAYERAIAVEASWQLREGSDLARAVGGHRFSLEQHLVRIYENPAAAWNRLAEALDRGGVDKAAYTLEHRPADLGRLHGHGLGRLETRSRREALAATPGASRELRGLATASAAVDAHRERVDGFSHTIEASGRRAEHIAASLRRLPDLDGLRQDLLRAGRALGTAALNALSETAVRAFDATTRLLGRTFGLHHDRGVGRGDDGLGLGR